MTDYDKVSQCKSHLIEFRLRTLFIEHRLGAGVLILASKRRRSCRELSMSSWTLFLYKTNPAKNKCSFVQKALWSVKWVEPCLPARNVIVSEQRQLSELVNCDTPRAVCCPVKGWNYPIYTFGCCNPHRTHLLYTEFCTKIQSVAYNFHTSVSIEINNNRGLT